MTYKTETVWFRLGGGSMFPGKVHTLPDCPFPCLAIGPNINYVRVNYLNLRLAPATIPVSVS